MESFFKTFSGLLTLKIINNNLLEKVSMRAVSIFSLSRRFGYCILHHSSGF